MTAAQLLPIAAAIVAGLVTAIGMLFREISKRTNADAKRIDALEVQLQEASSQRLATAEQFTKFALELTDKGYKQTEQLATVAESLQKTRGVR